MGKNNSDSVLIIGGGRGIGRAIVDVFAAHHLKITIASRTIDELEETAEVITKTNKAEIQIQKVDIASYADVSSVVNNHLKNFGSLKTIVNTAAIQAPVGPIWKNDPEIWAKTININLTGAFNVCRSVIPEMKSRNDGTIVLFSGGGGAYARPYFSAYGSSKTGVLRLVETVSLELKKTNINIYAIAPGAVKTKMTKEVVENKEMAGSVAYKEARSVLDNGGTSPEKAAQLCYFLAEKKPKNLCGRLIHVNEPYVKYCSLEESVREVDGGLLRRVPYFKDANAEIVEK